MKAVFDACVKADVDIPKEVSDFFGGEEPDHCGIEVSLEGYYVPYKDGMIEGFEINVTDLPDHVKIIRFYNSY
jgi:hypothetical protein